MKSLTGKTHLVSVYNRESIASAIVNARIKLVCPNYDEKVMWGTDLIMLPSNHAKFTGLRVTGETETERDGEFGLMFLGVQENVR